MRSMTPVAVLGLRKRFSLMAGLSGLEQVCASLWMHHLRGWTCLLKETFSDSWLGTSGNRARKRLLSSASRFLFCVIVTTGRQDRSPLQHGVSMLVPKSGLGFGIWGGKLGTVHGEANLLGHKFKASLSTASAQNSLKKWAAKGPAVWGTTPPGPKGLRPTAMIGDCRELWWALNRLPDSGDRTVAKQSLYIFLPPSSAVQQLVWELRRCLGALAI